MVTLNMVFNLIALLVLLQLSPLAATAATCGTVACGTAGSTCVTYTILRDGITFEQTIWVNTSTGVTYLPLPQTTSAPFPTIAAVNAGNAVAPNSASWTISGVRQLSAWSCVHVVISPASGAVYIDVTDATFAVTHDETTDTYSAGAPKAKFGVGGACSGATTVATLLSGTDALMGYANVNLSGTAFMVSGSTSACNGAGSCTCSCDCNGPVEACPGWSLSTWNGAGAIQFSPATQSLITLVDGDCGGWLPSPNSGQLALDGIAIGISAVCGGIPCGQAGSSCMTLPVTLAGVTKSQTFWVSSAGSTYLPLIQQTAPPFPTVAQINAGSAWAPNTASYYYDGFLRLTAFSCVRVIITGNPGRAHVLTTDLTFALSKDQTERYFGGAAQSSYAQPYGCNSTGVTVAGLLSGTVYPAAGYANVNLSGTAFLPTISVTTCSGNSSCVCSCQCNGPVVACPGLSIWTNLGAGYVRHDIPTQSMVLSSEGECGGWTMSPSVNLLQLDGSISFPPATPACGGVVCGTGTSSCQTIQATRAGTLSSQTLWVSGAGLTYLPLPQMTAVPYPTIAQVNTAGAYAPNVVAWTASGALWLTAWSCVRIAINASGSVYIDTSDATFAIMRDEVSTRYTVMPAGVQFGVGKACTGTTTVATLLAGTDATMAVANVNLSGTPFLMSGTSVQCGAATACVCSCDCNGPVVACPGWSLVTNGGAGAIRYNSATQSAVILADGNCGAWTPSPNTSQIGLDGTVLGTPSQSGSPSATTSSTQSQRSTPSATQSPTFSSSISSSPSRTPISVGQYSGTGFVDPCARGLAFLYLFGPSVGDSTATRGDDVVAASISWSGTPFKFCGVNYLSVFPSTNSIIALGASSTSYATTALPTSTLRASIVLFWNDMNTAYTAPVISGFPATANNIYWRVGNPPSARDSARMAADVTSQLPSEAAFSPTLVIVVTWFANAPYGNAGYLNTYQAVLASDATGRSFVTMCYDNLPGPGPGPAAAGLNKGDGVTGYSLPGSRTASVVGLTCSNALSSNGCYTFRVDTTLQAPTLTPTRSSTITQTQSSTQTVSRTSTGSPTPSQTIPPLACEGIPCGSGDSSCWTVGVVRGGQAFQQTLWVNSTSGVVYLPLSALTVEPFPTAASLATGASAAPNVVTSTLLGRALVTAYSCVRISVNASSGAFSLDPSDSTFSRTHDENTGSYTTASPAAVAYATPSACSGGTTDLLVAGQDDEAGFASVNLSGTVFAPAANPCGVAPACGCNASWGGAACPGFAVNSSDSFGVVWYWPATRAISLLTDGTCGGIAPFPDSRSIPLDGVLIPTTSQTSSPTLSQTPSQTTTQSVTRSSSATLSGSPTASQRRTPTQTQSLTRTTSGTRSQSLTPTLSRSQTQSSSVTATASQTPSQSLTSSVTQSLSPSESMSPSQSQSATLTCSQTASESATQSSSASQSPSTTATPSVSPTQSGTGTQTQTRTPSRSKSLSRSPSRSKSRSQSPSFTHTMTQSPSRSSTPSGTSSSSPAPTRSSTSSATASVTRTRSATLTRSVSQTPTRTQTGSQSQSKTLTGSKSPSASRSPSSSGTRTGSQVQTTSVTRTQSTTPSQFNTGSHSQTASLTTSMSQNSTSSSTQSSSQSVTPSTTQTPSGTSTLTRTPSSTGTLTLSSSPTGSASQSSSPSPSGSMTGSQSTSKTPSRSSSASQTTSPTQSVTASETQSESQAGSGTQPRTRSPSQAPTASGTHTQATSGSSTGTRTPSTSGTWSTTGTASQSHSASQTATRSPSPSQFVTRSQSRSQSRSASQTQSATRSPSQTRSGTTSPSLTATQSRSPSQTRSQTKSQTRSRTRTRSPTATTTPSQASTRTQTGSSSGTPSGTVTPTATWTATQTYSGTQGPTPSVSPSISQSPSETTSQRSTPTLTRSPSITRTQTRTWTMTSTASQVRTPSETQSPSLTLTRSPSRTGTRTQSTSMTSTRTRSSSRTPSLSGTSSMPSTPSQKQTPSCTPSQGATPTQTASVTTTPSPTTSPSISQSGSPSPTMTPTQSPTLSSSPSLTLTRSRTQTPSVSSSQRATPSNTPSETTSASQTATLTQTRSQTASQSVTRTRSQTPTQTLTRTASLSMSRSQRSSSSMSVSPSRTATQAASASQTISQARSQSLSATPSTTVTSSESQSRSQTGTGTTTQSRTLTQSASQTKTITPSFTGTRSGTSSGTGTPSRSGSASQSHTGSQDRTSSSTGSPSQTQSRSLPPSVSSTQTRSAVSTPSNTQSATASQTRSQTTSSSSSPTQSETASSTATQAPSPTMTPTMTRSITQSASVTSGLSTTSTPTESLSQGPTPSPTQGVTPSQVPSGTITSTPSGATTNTQTGTASARASTSGTPSQSQARSRSPSVTVTPSVTAGLTRSATPSQTPSQRRTSSSTSTRSPTATRSSTGSASGSRTPSRTASATLTQSNSLSLTPSVSPSPSGSQAFTPSMTTTRTESSTSSATMTVTRTQNGSVTMSSTMAPTTSGTQSASLSLTASRTQTASQTQSPSQTRTGSKTGSETVSPSQVSTASVSPTQFASGSHTQTRSSTSTPTLSPSQRATASGTASATSSPSLSTSPSTSVTPSVSSTMSGTPSLSSSGSGSTSGTPSMSETPSQLHTPSQSGTPSSTQSRTGTATQSQALTSSLTPSRSQTRTRTTSQASTASSSLTRSSSQAATVTPSGTPSMTTSKSGSQTRTPSTTRSPSQSVSPTSTQTRSGSQTPTSTVTSTQVPSASQTRSQTATATGSQGATRSATVSPSQAVTPSGTQSTTLSSSGSPSPAPTSSVSGSPTQAPTTSASATRSSTGTRSVTQSLSLTQSPSLASTGSQTGTITLTRSSTGTPTATATASMSATASQTQTFSQTTSRTPSQTATASQRTTRSGSMTPTQRTSSSVTSTASNSASQTESASQSGTGSLSSSITVSPSVTSTLTATASSGATRSVTRSQILTGSITSTSLGTPTSTQTSSQSRSPSSTGSNSQFSTASVTSTETRSPSATRSLTNSGTQSQAQTPTGTPSGSVTHSQTGSATFSQTQSGTATASTSGSGTPSAASTPSATQSKSQSATPSPSKTLSQLETASRTQSSSRSPSLTPSRTLTPSQVASRSSTATPSPAPTSSNTGSGSGTPSRTGSSSLSRTPSATSTETQSRSISASPSDSSTRSGSSSASGTRSMSCTPSLSPTASASASSSQSGTESAVLTPTGSGTPSGSLSSTLTGSRTSSQKRTPSATGSRTLTRSRSQTSTASRSITPSRTRTVSGTRSQTGTRSISRSSSQTETPSATASRSPSFTKTRSQTLSVTMTQSPTRSVSASMTVSAAPGSSASATPSASETPSITGSASTTGSASGSASASSSHSQAPSVAPSPLPPASATPSLTRGASPSATSTLRPSSPRASSSRSRSTTRSPSLTGTRSRSRTPSTSPIPSQTPTMSGSATRTSTRSATGTGSQSITPTQQRSSSDTPSPGSSRSPSGTATPTQTRTSSSIPYSLDLAVLSESNVTALRAVLGAPESALVLSDSLPVAMLAGVLNRCPAVSGQRSLALSCASTQPAALLTSVVLPSSATGAVASVLQAVSCVGGTVGEVSLPQTVSAHPSFRSPSSTMVLNCAVTGSDGSAMGSAALMVYSVATLWPLYDDVVVCSSDGFMRSSLLKARINSTDVLRSASCLLGTPSVAAASNTTLCTVAAALVDPLPALSAVRTIWESQVLPTTTNSSSSSTSPFTLTLMGSTRIALRASIPAFTNGTTVTIGNVRCTSTLVSDDGRWLVTVTPSQEELCQSAEDCGYQTLVVSNPDSGTILGASLSSRRLAEDSLSSTFLGAALSCPPFCPGTVSSTVVPLPLSALTSGAGGGTSGARTGAVTFVPGRVVSTPSGGSGLTALPSSAYSTSSVGLYYTVACADTGAYTDPVSGACSNASNPASAQCAFGSGSQCQPCPTGALCPGGFRAWPLPGYWSAAETIPSVTPCTPPSPKERCVGWDPSLSRTSCGPLYRPGSYLCSSCADGTYGVDDGGCRACPSDSGPWARYSGLLMLMAALLAFALVVYVCLVAVIRMAGGSVRGGAARMVPLLVWLVMTVQTVAQVARVASSSLPPILQVVYRAVALIQLQGIVLPPACTGGYAFQTEVSLMSAGLLCTGAASVAYVWGHGSLRKWVGGVAVTAALLLHATVAETSVGLLNCVPVSLPRTALSSLDGYGSYSPPPALASQLVTVRLLAGDPFFVCFEGQHTTAGALAACVLVLYIVLLPALALRWLWRSPALIAELAAARAAATDVAKDAAIKYEQEKGFDGASAATPPALPRAQARAKASRGPKLPPPDPLLAPFLGDSGYAPRFWFWRHIDLAIMLALAVNQGVQPRPTDPQSIIVKTAFICVVMLPLCVAVYWMRPYAPGHEWKRGVRCALLLLSVACTVVNAAVAVYDAGGNANYTLYVFVTVGSYAVFVQFLLTMALLITGFAGSLLKSAREEEEQRRAAIRTARIARLKARARRAARSNKSGVVTPQVGGGESMPSDAPPRGAEEEEDGGGLGALLRAAAAAARGGAVVSPKRVPRAFGAFSAAIANARALQEQKKDTDKAAEIYEGEDRSEPAVDALPLLPDPAGSVVAEEKAPSPQHPPVIVAEGDTKAEARYQPSESRANVVDGTSIGGPIDEAGNGITYDAETGSLALDAGSSAAPAAPPRWAGRFLRRALARKRNGDGDAPAAEEKPALLEAAPPVPEARNAIEVVECPDAVISAAEPRAESAPLSANADGTVALSVASKTAPGIAASSMAALTKPPSSELAPAAALVKTRDMRGLSQLVADAPPLQQPPQEPRHGSGSNPPKLSIHQQVVDGTSIGGLINETGSGTTNTDETGNLALDASSAAPAAPPRWAGRFLRRALAQQRNGDGDAPVAVGKVFLPEAAPPVPEARNAIEVVECPDAVSSVTEPHAESAPLSANADGTAALIAASETAPGSAASSMAALTKPPSSELAPAAALVKTRDMRGLSQLVADAPPLQQPSQEPLHRHPSGVFSPSDDSDLTRGPTSTPSLGPARRLLPLAPLDRSVVAVTTTARGRAASMQTPRPPSAYLHSSPGTPCPSLRSGSSTPVSSVRQQQQHSPAGFCLSGASMPTVQPACLVLPEGGEPTRSQTASIGLRDAALPSDDLPPTKVFDYDAATATSASLDTDSGSSVDASEHAADDSTAGAREGIEGALVSKPPAQVAAPLGTATSVPALSHESFSSEAPPMRPALVNRVYSLLPMRAPQQPNSVRPLPWGLQSDISAMHQVVWHAHAAASASSSPAARLTTPPLTVSAAASPLFVNRRALAAPAHIASTHLRRGGDGSDLDEVGVPRRPGHVYPLPAATQAEQSSDDDAAGGASALAQSFRAGRGGQATWAEPSAAHQLSTLGPRALPHATRSPMLGRAMTAAQGLRVGSGDPLQPGQSPPGPALRLPWQAQADLAALTQHLSPWSSSAAAAPISLARPASVAAMRSWRRPLGTPHVSPPPPAAAPALAVAAATAATSDTDDAAPLPVPASDDAAPLPVPASDDEASAAMHPRAGTRATW